MKAKHFSSLGSAFRNALIIVAGITVLAIFASPAASASPIHFGVRCEEDFQNGWLPSMDVYTGCEDLVNIVQSHYPASTVDFYYNLQGALPDFEYGQGAETCNSCGGADSVDFFFMATHGGIVPHTAQYAMWDYNTFAYTKDMRLGNSGKQLKALATFSCDTLYNADGRLPVRWGNAFAGGVKIVVGAHDLLWDDSDDTAMGNFAQGIAADVPIGYSWLYAVYNANNDNQPAIANTGSNAANCWSRQGVALNNLMSEPVLRDSKIGYYCWTNWN